MKDILSEIIAHKRSEVEQEKKVITPEQLREQLEALPLKRQQRSMKQALATSSTGIIAEFKRRSPSKGWIHREADAGLIPPAYEAAGAAALSILTDRQFFGGSLKDLCTARPLVSIPILRKDFIIDPYQLMQARVAGADAVLLIAACLQPDECAALTDRAHALGLEVLLEIHNTSELQYVTPQADMVGVNNRNLGTFITDTDNSFRIAKELCQTVAECSTGTQTSSPLLVSESGISNPETVCQLRKAGFRGFLMGENFMKNGQPDATLRSFIKALHNPQTAI